jgi:phosphoglycerate dehydrogenase-like enzyme
MTSWRSRFAWTAAGPPAGASTVPDVKVFLPFDPSTLPEIPDGFDIEVVNATRGVPDTVTEVELYVPAYEFTSEVVDVMADMPRLRIVQTLTAGVDNIRSAVPAGVTLCNAAGVHDAATSELAVGLMISAERRLAELAVLQRERRWDQQMASSLADRRVLVVGAGHIGAAIRRRLDGFECDVTMVGRTARDGVRGVDELPELLPAADIVVLIIPLTDQTKGMVDAAFLARMPDGALLVNVARGPIVDTDALVAETSAGRLRAALDVTDPEPLPPEHPLWSSPGVIITPHIGGASSALWPRARRLVSEQLRRLADGRPLLNVVG